MQIKMSDKVVEWYKEDLSLTEGDFVRFYVRYGGFNSFVKGFSLGIDKENPEQSHTLVEKDGITFFIEDDDTWYFEDKDLVIDFNELIEEPVFIQG
ncbi:HesB/YadR/YfhF family protein [Bacillus tuaregi]|uniref:HesB/YadR/YfhF family protein n=1 Tax=Bacillus tuaregi TaxID=1816695 RepID=UPI0008F940CE|nr:iron-sulfur cluster biosynthesis family protein [Bacillus tuaregi]